MAIQSLLVTCIVDHIENWDVAIVNIPGAFLQAEMDEWVHMKFEEKWAELIVILDPKMYWKFVQHEGGKSILYFELKKALYGTLQSTLLFWEHLSAFRKSFGFKLNPNDWCVANKMINGKQYSYLK